MKATRNIIAAIYARVSTKDQSCDMQLTELREFCKRMGWTIVKYVDAGFSGTKRNRPEFLRLMADARLRKFDVVLVWKMDRFGRSLQHIVESVLELQQLGIRFLSPTQGIDTDAKSLMGKAIMYLFGLFAELERDLIVERVSAGIAEAKRKGKHCGRPMTVFRRDVALALHESGWSWRQLEKRFGIPQSTIRAGVRDRIRLLQGVQKGSLQPD